MFSVIGRGIKFSSKSHYSVSCFLIATQGAKIRQIHTHNTFFKNFSFAKLGRNQRTSSLIKIHNSSTSFPKSRSEKVVYTPSLPLSSSVLASFSFLPHNILQNGLNTLHIWSGLPWWASIAACAVAMRIAVFPVMLKMMKTSAKLAIINPKVAEHMSVLSKAKAEGNSELMMQATTQIQNLYKVNNVNPLNLLSAPVFQGILFISFFYALKTMAGVPVEGFTDGGFWWVNDLSQPDPLHIFPVANGLLMLLNIELGSETGSNKVAMSPSMKKFFRFLCLASPLFTMNFPMAIFMYWFPSNVFSVFQGAFLRSSTIRHKLGLPEVPSAMPVPNAQNESFVKSFTDIVHGVQEKGKYPQASEILDATRFLKTDTNNEQKPTNNSTITKATTLSDNSQNDKSSSVTKTTEKKD
ncbi:Mitochondrial inner membrane protein oxa1-2 [Schizosaccharomyces pombe]